MSLIAERAPQLKLSVVFFFVFFFYRISEELDLFFTPSSSSGSISTLHLQCHAFLFPPYYCERLGIEVAVVTGPALIGGDSCMMRG